MSKFKFCFFLQFYVIWGGFIDEALNWACYLIPIIPAVGKLRQEDLYEFKVSLDCKITE